MDINKDILELEELDDWRNEKKIRLFVMNIVIYIIYYFFELIK